MRNTPKDKKTRIQAKEDGTNGIMRFYPTFPGENANSNGIEDFPHAASAMTRPSPNVFKDSVASLLLYRVRRERKEEKKQHRPTNEAGETSRTPVTETSGDGDDHIGEESYPMRALDAGVPSSIATATTLDEDANGEDPKSGPDEKKRKQEAMGTATK